MTTQDTVDFAQSLTYTVSMNWYAGRPTTAANTIVRNTYILTTYKIAGVHNCMFSGHAVGAVRDLREPADARYDLAGPAVASLDGCRPDGRKRNRPRL